MFLSVIIKQPKNLALDLKENGALIWLAETELVCLSVAMLLLLNIILINKLLKSLQYKANVI